ncbi:MAG: error-prone DNA polymerase [Lautropia sp.]|nr:error-prone DNA polymerase [Lautropia sp.]MCL4702901.1 error-prone DNA polymerase [Burkholderiaceae bacterium]MDL1907755.1 error-prone DNA polymerase [Betaproteobacteria bacterium PRO1]RIK89426.1 MAG: error-prone DNA polymerase [Burkholderiales bacterium]
MLSPYAELLCASNFSFLHGASHPEELVERARALGYSALAITDECSLAGVVRAHLRARQTGLPLLVGAQFSLHEAFGSGSRLVLIAASRNGYGNLSELITRARMRAGKGRYRLLADDLANGLDDCLALLVPSPAIAVDASADSAAPSTDSTCAPPVDSPCAQLLRDARFLRERFDGRCWLGVPLLVRGHDAALLERTRGIAAATGLPRVAVGDVLHHLRSRKALQDTLTAIRLNTPLAALGYALASNAEQHLRSRLRLARLYPPALLEETLEVAARCRFSLDELRYEYPEEIVPPGHTPASWLRRLVFDGVPGRYPDGLPPAVAAQIEHELALIAELKYEPYFLTVADIVHFARSRGILCQGRGSAANSAVCYCLGITEVDPARASVLFERFISRERNEPPDIDVDFEHQRREEVIQYLYAKYGRHRAALAATVISYRSRSALRDVGRALGIDAQRIEQLARTHQWWDRSVQPERLREAGFDPSSTLAQQWLELAGALRGFPRHLSQHTGGFVIARDALTRLVPVENAAMPGRSVIEWDKDDLDALGLLKVDVLALGMLTAIRRALGLIGQRRGLPFRIQDIPAEDPATYEMISRADTIGVFQIESRAQMSMLPRLRPRRFYDLVVQVAIVRPGPIQGGMVHPYLRRRMGLEPVVYPRDEIRPALERTLGVPIFQEQVMQVAMLAAGFSGGEADALRRAMAAWRRKGGLEPFEQRLVDGMLARGYRREFADAIFRQIQGFGEYGFPESHAASFALLVYVSAWIKRHEPAAFLAALLNSQPMGFYAPAQLVRDAREHGIEVRGVDVLASDWDCTLEEAPQGGFAEATDVAPAEAATAEAPGRTPAYVAPADGSAIDWRAQPAVRLGLNRVRGLSQAGAQRLLEARAARRRARGADFAFDSVEDLAREARLDARELQALAQADALRQLAGHRAQAHWEAAGIRSMPALLADARFDETPARLPALPEGREIIADYRGLGIPMGRHPLELLRPRLERLRIATAAALRAFPNGRPARASGLVTHRQRPETAKGTIFVTLEDETGAVNVIVWPRVFERQRREVLGAQLMTVYGTWQCDADSGGEVRHLVAQRIVDHSALLGDLVVGSRDFR